MGLGISHSGARAKPANPESVTTAGGYGFRLSPLSRLGRNDERPWLLRRDAHFGSGRAHVGIDVLLVFDEVLLEHAHQLARGLVERGFVLPGLHPITHVPPPTPHPAPHPPTTL